MKPLVAVLFLVGSSVLLGQGKAGSRHVVLPNPALIRCDTSHLWQHEELETDGVYPVQVSVDNFDRNGCPLGLIAIYDKSVPLNEIKLALDQRYGKWGKADTGKIKIYRVEPERFAIQLTTIETEFRGAAGQKGMKQLVYISFSVSQSSNGF